MRPAPSRSGSSRAVMTTRLGDITLELYRAVAPASVEAFLELVGSQAFVEAASFFRAVKAKSAPRAASAIDIVQGGLRQFPSGARPLRHEPTGDTGLKHRDGVLSWARGPLNRAGGASFFISIGEQPALDQGGARDPFGDGQGFAAFGAVLSGMDVVRAIHRNATDDADFLLTPISISATLCLEGAP